MSYIIGCVDLETLSVYDDAIILSVGVCCADITKYLYFDELTQAGLFLKFDFAEQLKLGRKKLKSTVDWWVNQPEAAKKISLYPSVNDISIKLLSDKIIEWFEKQALNHKDIDMWSRVQGFERFKIQHVCETLGLTQLLNKNRYFDVVTLAHNTQQDRYAGISPKDYETENFIYHHPLHDAALDVIRVQKLMVDAGMLDQPIDFKNDEPF